MSSINVSNSIKVIVKSNVCTPQLMILKDIELTCRSKSDIDENQKLMKCPRINIETHGPTVGLLNLNLYSVAAVAQSVRAFASQAKGWVFESQL